VSFEGPYADAGEGAIATGTTGKPRSRQASNPPASGRMCETPRFRSMSATRALVASLGQEQ
jgi:hypothetical protein